MRGHGSSLLLYHPLSGISLSPNITTTTNSNGIGGDEIVFWPGEEGGRTRSKRVEHSVSAGDKGEACQRPHSSELTHTTANIKHTYIHMHTQSSFIYPPMCLFATFFNFLIPFLLSLSLFYPLCLSSFFFAHFSCPLCIILCLHIFCH